MIVFVTEVVVVVGIQIHIHQYRTRTVWYRNVCRCRVVVCVYVVVGDYVYEVFSILVGFCIS